MTNPIVRVSNRSLHLSDLSAEKSPLFAPRPKTGLAYNLFRKASNKADDNVKETETLSKNQDLSQELVPDLHEPAYLIDQKPKVGYYDLLDLQLKGYDFVVLEKYQSYIHKTMKKMDFKVVRAWAVPYQELQLENLSDRSTAVEHEYKIKIYERNIQMQDALVTKLPLLIDIINITSPPGVSFSIHRHTSELEDKIYFRDSVLENLREELQELKDTPLIGVA